LGQPFPEGEPKISDFGMARVIEAGLKEGQTKANIGIVFPLKTTIHLMLPFKHYSFGFFVLNV
jgi:hypothetical protein